MASAPRILIIVTSHAALGSTGEPTGLWFEELAAPYYEFVGAGSQVDIASPKGGHPPIDPRSEQEPGDAVKRFRDDPEAMQKLSETLRIADVREPYDAYFVVGGHGVMWDLAEDDTLAKLLGLAHGHGKVISAVCHGPAALLRVRSVDGEPLIKDRRVTGFSDEEERAVQLADKVPFLLESRLAEVGAQYERGPMWGSFVVADGRLITGQNPQSSVATAREVLAALA